MKCVTSKWISLVLAPALAVALPACADPNLADAGGGGDDAGGPGCGPERCDGLDDDCDGLVDEGVERAGFVDTDGDGYGDDALPATGCLGAGLAELGGDCDDTRADVWPGRAELCEPGVDYDCNGLSGCDDESCSCGPLVVSAGSFLMGSPESEEGHDSDEVLHTVTLTRSFVMMPHEVTQTEWRELTDSSPSRFEDCGDDCPVESVNWYEALTYANLLSDADGLARCYELTACVGLIGLGCSGDSVSTSCEGGYECNARWLGPDCEGWRLPTEAEWEYAARAGTQDAHPGGNELEAATEVGWCATNSEATVHPVGLFPPNPWGLYDVVGNVYEWTWDRYGPYEASREQIDPSGNLSGELRAIRGGTIALALELCRTANRGSHAPLRRSALLGLRLVRTVP